MKPPAIRTLQGTKFIVPFDTMKIFFPSFFVLQIASVMRFKKCPGILFEFPFRYSAPRTRTHRPFISKPTCCPRVPGIVYTKNTVTMCCHSGITSVVFNRFNSVKHTTSCRPKFHFIDQRKKFNILTIKSLRIV